MHHIRPIKKQDLIQLNDTENLNANQDTNFGFSFHWKQINNDNFSRKYYFSLSTLIQCIILQLSVEFTCNIRVKIVSKSLVFV